MQKIFTQLVGAVSYVHNNSCVHRDLKLENILLDKNENVKLIDFGFTREYEGKASYLQTFCGTVCYSAPEMLKGEKYAGEKVDVWSLGIIMFALLTGGLPFDEDDDQATKAKILKEEPKYPDTIPPPARTLISKLLSKRSLYRPTLAEILSDPYLAEHAPQQQAILKLTTPAPFTTALEKATLERMRSAGVDLDQVIENVLAQRCDALAGWWALLIEKEERKEARRERKRKEREAEIKSIRRISASSTRLLTPALADVSEEHPFVSTDDEAKNRGRRERRSTRESILFADLLYIDRQYLAQLVIPDLPKLPEASAVESPASATPPVPLEKDPVRTNSASRPPPPPKDYRRRSSHLQLVTANADLLQSASIAKRRSRRHPQSLMNQLASLKHWFVESAKRAKSPGKAHPNLLTKSSPGLKDAPDSRHSSTTPTRASQQANGAQNDKLTPNSAHLIMNATTKRVSSLNQTSRAMTAQSHHQRNSLSPSPMTPRSSSYRRPSSGLRGRKSTSSSISSIRSIHHRHSHSKASSTSSKNSIDNMSTPTNMSGARSPHSSIKVLPATPQTTTPLPSNIRLVRHTGGLEPLMPSPAFSESATPPASPPSGLVFARRKKSPFRGPMIITDLASLSLGNGQGTPGLRSKQDRLAPANSLDLLSGQQGRRGSRRGLPTTTEEEEEEEDEIEEVDAFSPVVMKRGESLHTITLLDDVPTQEVDDGTMLEAVPPDAHIATTEETAG